MRLTTLGTGTIALAADRVRAGHLVEAAGVRLLMDCGSGLTHRLARHGVDWMGITHVALTHFHEDHVADLPTLLFAFRHGALPPRSQPMVVLGPQGTRALMERLAAAHGEWVLSPEFPLEVVELAPGARHELGPGVILEPFKVPHTDESVAYSVEADGARVVYTGDTGMDDALGRWAAGCDVLLCECSLPAEMAIPSHLTPEQCGELAAIAIPKHLVLTHFYPPVERVDIATLVAQRFGGRLSLAHDGWHIDTGDHACWS